MTFCCTGFGDYDQFPSEDSIAATMAWNIARAMQIGSRNIRVTYDYRTDKYAIEFDRSLPSHSTERW